MKTPARSSQGIALIIVLAMLVLLSGLLVAFMSTATTERSATFANSGGVSARQIADNTVNLVINQIREATNPQNNAGQPLENATWASQPGAIRIYSGAQTSQRQAVGSGAAADANYPLFTAGSEDKIYKLFSTDKMVEPLNGQNQAQPFADDINVIENWNRASPTPEYVDLNQPIIVPRRDRDPSGTVVEPHYPIVDPRALYTVTGAQNAGPAPGMVDGFDAKVVTDNVLTLAPSGNATSSAKVPYIPMPVKWMYVLRDGRMFTGKQIEAQPALIENNPIVGRTAFWVDDETAKININTASEGTFWDTPMASAQQEAGQITGANQLVGGQTDLSLGAAQPARLEYQRFPGHPATTCLSPVFGLLWGYAHNIPPYPNRPEVYNFKEGNRPKRGATASIPGIYEFAPFIPTGRNTSYGATVEVDPDRSFSGASEYERTIRTKHLYASVDEMIFKPKRLGTNASATKAEINSPLTPEALEKTRFFVTAQSRAPDVNLFGRPRVTIWPVHTREEFRTQFDTLFLFASTVYRASNGQPKHYNITRSDAKSATIDFNTNNRALYEYLQWLTSQPFPGFGNISFESKYTKAERDAILTQMFDYVRAVNLVDTGTASRGNPGDPNANVFAPYTPPFFDPAVAQEGYGRIGRSLDWSGQVTPLRPPSAVNADANMQGHGRFITLQEAAVIISDCPVPPGQPATARAMRAMLVLELVTTTPGFVGLRPTYYTRVNPVAGRETRIRTPGSTTDQIINLCGRPDEAVRGHARGLIDIPNMSSHEVTFGRAFMPTIGFSTALHFFPENFGPTNLSTLPLSTLVAPWNDPARNRNFTVLRKVYFHDHPHSRSYRRATDTAQGAQANPTGTVGTVKIYPYVSQPIVYTPGNPNQMIFTGGAFDIQIWAGENPDDPRANEAAADKNATGLVQEIRVSFPATPITANVPTRGAAAREFWERFDGSLDGRWNCINYDGAVDFVRGVEFVGKPTTAVPRDPNATGDIRLAAVQRQIDMTVTQPQQFQYQPRDGNAYYSANMSVHGLQCAHGDPVTGHTGVGRLHTNATVRTSKQPTIPRLNLSGAALNGVRRNDGGPGDWDRGLSKHTDGAAINKVDEGNVGWNINDATVPNRVPYYRGRAIESTKQTMFSPNRQLSSPVMFGSIPSGAQRGRQWETLLFRPSRETGREHPGATLTPDHLWLDLFHMPVVEPYAISEPMSTAGKVNLNYVIAPFGYARGAPGTANGTQRPRSYLRRDTALRGVLKSVYIMAIPTGITEGAHQENPGSISQQLRFPLNLDRTIDALEARLKDPRGSLFRSASEICTVDLYPSNTSPSQAPSVSNWASFWDQNGNTGDNMRERPYSHIYPRVTTKSNTYTVHMWCQAIRKSSRSKPGEFDPALDQVLGEYRGSATIERFIDPNDPEMKDYREREERLDRYYRYRVVNTKHFSPR
jgi:hypothetical protein